MAECVLQTALPPGHEPEGEVHVGLPVAVSELIEQGEGVSKVGECVVVAAHPGESESEVAVGKALPDLVGLTPRGAQRCPLSCKPIVVVAPTGEEVREGPG